MTYLGPITAAPCRFCKRPMRLVERARICPDVVHCRNREHGTAGYYVAVDHMRRGVAA